MLEPADRQCGKRVRPVRINEGPRASQAGPNPVGVKDHESTPGVVNSVTLAIGPTAAVPGGGHRLAFVI